MPKHTDAAITALEAAQKAFDKIPTSSENWIQPWSRELVTSLSLGVLGFSVIGLVLATLLLWRSGADPQQVLRVFGILTIVGFSALLLVVGYSNEQLTPIVGLFGAIAGYLLGRDPKTDGGDQKAQHGT